MAEDLGGVLREVSVLLRRLTEQNDVATQRREEDRIRWEANRGPMEEATKRRQTLFAEFSDPQKRSEEMKIRIEEARVLGAKQREEDVQFRQQLLHEIERHNRLLEMLMDRLAQRRTES